jgi:hypothetical protein
VAFIHSTPAGIAMIIIYVVYQQFENHVLQVTIMAKTVHINQLVVLVSVLIGVELLGFLGALLAIPVAGILQVIGRDVWDHKMGQLKDEPTIGVEEVPISEVVEHAEKDPHQDADRDGTGDADSNGDRPDSDGAAEAAAPDPAPERR